MVAEKEIIEKLFIHKPMPVIIE